MLRAERLEARPDDLEELRRRYVETILAPRARDARAMLLSAADDGVPVQRLYLDVLRPAMHEVGRLWEQARISVAQEHLATQITQTVLAQLALRMDPCGSAGAGRRALVACSGGELHTIGGQMVADFLEADGWDVLLLGADTPPDQVAETARDRRADLVALSTALPGHLLSASLTCSLLKRLDPAPFVVAGGQGYGGRRARALAVGADEYAPDPEALLAVLAARFGAADGRAAR